MSFLRTYWALLTNLYFFLMNQAGQNIPINLLSHFLLVIIDALHSYITKKFQSILTLFKITYNFHSIWF